MNSECSRLNIPEKLHRQEREIDSFFNADELLFRRFKCREPISSWKDSRQISASIFKLDCDSCNRSKYSEPLDVLFNVRSEKNGAHYTDFGIVELKVGNVIGISKTLVDKTLTTHYKLNVIHSPLECMYPHSEIILLSDSEEKVENPTKAIKSMFRLFLIDNCKIIKELSE